ncbi:hypothetical protein FHT32_000207 [Variovorax sp. SG517]|uniref:DUF7710 domain-containing protein n=1 Tax=Variovorax sp. SG517 TaxID=2587117 RepID=UPI00159EA1E0|nr:hypothetical protein [Variovorax sp. SG517]NVM86584.1 hypothetical protein [Variovorax sp. SG517]
MADIREVWVFSGVNAKFPSAVFAVKEDAFEWIRKYELTGVLTRYPVGISVYEWAIESGNFKVRSQRDSAPEFVGKFSSAMQEHMHFENGIFA